MMILNAAEICKYLECMIEKRPDIYVSELQNALFEVYGTEVDATTITRALYHRGFTRKKVCIATSISNWKYYILWFIAKVTCPARERNEEQRAIFQADIGENYPPETLVFLDESACNRMTTQRNMGWAPIGKRARRHDYFVRGQRYAACY